MRKTLRSLLVGSLIVSGVEAKVFTLTNVASVVGIGASGTTIWVNYDKLKSGAKKVGTTTKKVVKKVVKK
jgi:hypothetical protein